MFYHVSVCTYCRQEESKKNWEFHSAQSVIYNQEYNFMLYSGVIFSTAYLQVLTHISIHIHHIHLLNTLYLYHLMYVCTESCKTQASQEPNS
ncbi:hypothetical protein EON63_06900 [archaeon]|nr:MAG: hypothetical protein EON63_06900 [archaeon]